MDYDADLPLDESDEFWIQPCIWKYHEGFLDKGVRNTNFLLAFYNETELYGATVKENKFIVTFDEESLNGKFLIKEQERRLDSILDGKFTIEIDEANKMLTVEIKK